MTKVGRSFRETFRSLTRPPYGTLLALVGVICFIVGVGVVAGISTTALVWLAAPYVLLGIVYLVLFSMWRE